MKIDIPKEIRGAIVSHLPKRKRECFDKEAKEHAEMECTRLLESVSHIKERIQKIMKALNDKIFPVIGFERGFDDEEMKVAKTLFSWWPVYWSLGVDEFASIQVMDKILIADIRRAVDCEVVWTTVTQCSTTARCLLGKVDRIEYEMVIHERWDIIDGSAIYNRYIDFLMIKNSTLEIRVRIDMENDEYPQHFTFGLSVWKHIGEDHYSREEQMQLLNDNYRLIQNFIRMLLECQSEPFLEMQIDGRSWQLMKVFEFHKTHGLRM